MKIISIKHHNLQPGKVDYCQITGSKDLFTAIDLGHQAPCDLLLSKDSLNQPEATYPLSLKISASSSLGQLSYAIDGYVLYPQDYFYRSNVSKPLKDYLLSLGTELFSQFSFPQNSFCLDIGCNDGTLLSSLKKHHFQVLGVEPTNMGNYAIKKNKVPVIQDYFTSSLAKKILQKNGQAKLITMTNVFAHMINLGEVMTGLCQLLDKDGVFVSESQYLLDVLERNQFDLVYHEHMRLYSLKSLVKLFSYYGLEIFDAQRVWHREGSLRVYVSWKNRYPVSKNVNQLLKQESKAHLSDPKVWKQWRQNIETEKIKTMEFLYRLKKQGKKIVADSCPGRGVVLLNYYGIDETLIPYVSQTPGSEKIGKFIPGTHIPIVSNQIILKDQPDYVLILAWHYADYIISNWRKKGLKSKFIIPLPKLKII